MIFYIIIAILVGVIILAFVISILNYYDDLVDTNPFDTPQCLEELIEKPAMDVTIVKKEYDTGNGEFKTCKYCGNSNKKEREQCYYCGAPFKL